MTTATDIISRAADFGIIGKCWEKGGRLRIYAETTRRDITVYLDLDGTRDDVQGAALKVFCSTDQHRNWLKSQVTHYKNQFLPMMHAYVIEHYSDAGPRPNGYGEDINDMIDTARDFMKTHAQEKHAGDALPEQIKQVANPESKNGRTFYRCPICGTTGVGGVYPFSTCPPGCDDCG